MHFQVLASHAWAIFDTCTLEEVQVIESGLGVEATRAGVGIAAASIARVAAA